jgi:iron(III) transport system substrate-binding protein
MHAALIALIFTFAIPASAQDWRAEWDKIVAAAKKEGEINVAHSVVPTVRRVIEPLWAKVFPDIKMKSSVGNEGWATRVKEERRIGKYLHDIFLGGPSAGLFEIAQEALDPIVPALILPEARNEASWGGWANVFADKARNRVFGYTVLASSFWYDANAVPRDKVEAQGFKVLLDPAYKGRISWWDPRLSGAGSVYADLINRIEGWDTLKRIIVDQESIFYPNAQTLTEAFVRGKLAFSIGANLETRLEAQFKEIASQFKVRQIGNTPNVSYIAYGSSVLALANKPVNPNAAKLFVNWFLTKEVQVPVLTGLQHNSPRRDLPQITKDDAVPRPGLTYLRLQREQEALEREALIDRIKELMP